MTVLLLFISAFLVRLINLNQSLWLDETIVAKVVRTIPLLQIPFQFSIHDFHPPLYYMVMSLWSTFFGSSEIALRMPSIIFSLIAGLYVYKIGSLLKDSKTATWATAFFLFNPLIVYYSQEARMYMMATAFLTAALFHFIRIVIPMKIGIQKGDLYRSRIGVRDDKQTRMDDKGEYKYDVLFFNAFSVLAMLTFYGSAFFILGMILTYVISTFFVIPAKAGIQEDELYRSRVVARDDKQIMNMFVNYIDPGSGSGMTGKLPEMTKKIISMTWGFSLSLLLLSPLLLQQLTSAKMGLEVVKNWSLVLGKAELKNFFMIFLKFATGRLSWYPKWSYYLFAGLPTLFIWILALLGMRKNKVLSFLFLFPLGVGLVVSFFTPMMMYFRFLYLIPVMSLLLGLGVIPGSFVIQTKVGIQEDELYRSRVVARDDKQIMNMFVNYIDPGSGSGMTHKIARMTTILIFLLFSFLYLLSPQFHREDWKKMVENINPMRPVYMILPSSDPLSYYNPTLAPLEMRNMQETALPEYIQVIPYVEELYGYNHEEILKKKECILESRSTYRGPLIVENWKCQGERLAKKF